MIRGKPFHSTKTAKNGKTPEWSNEISSFPAKICGFHLIYLTKFARVK